MTVILQLLSVAPPYFLRSRQKTPALSVTFPFYVRAANCLHFVLALFAEKA